METRIDCISEYGILQRIGSGTFSNVFKVKRIATGEIFAMKVMKRKFKSIEDVDDLEEIKYMRILGYHPNVVQLHDVIYEPKLFRLSLILDFMDFDLLRLLSTPSFFQEDVVHYSQQIISGINYIHSAIFIHCDIKPENVMINLRTRELKIGDLGSLIEDPGEYKKGEYICTRWYRAPEILLKSKHFGSAIDVWSAGCVIAEMILKKPLFPGQDTLHQLQLIHDSLHHVPTQEQLDAMEADARYRADMFALSDPLPQGIKERLTTFCENESLIDAVVRMLEYDPSKRITTHELLDMDIFASQPSSRKMSKTTKMLVKSTNDVGFQVSQRIVPTQIALQTDRPHEAPISQKRSCVTFAKIFKPTEQRHHISLPEKFPKTRSSIRLTPL